MVSFAETEVFLSTKLFLYTNVNARYANLYNSNYNEGYEMSAFLCNIFDSLSASEVEVNVTERECMRVR